MTLVPFTGTLKNYVFENEFLNIAPAVVYDIDLPIRPFDYHGVMQETLVCLCRIRFDVSDWRRLANCEFRFPVNPTDGYVDGSIYLGDAHNPADVTRIHFGHSDGDILEAEIDIQFDFTYEGLSELGKPKYKWKVALQLDPDALDSVIREAKIANK